MWWPPNVTLYSPRERRTLQILLAPFVCVCFKCLFAILRVFRWLCNVKCYQRHWLSLVWFRTVAVPCPPSIYPFSLSLLLHAKHKIAECIPNKHKRNVSNSMHAHRHTLNLNPNRHNIWVFYLRADFICANWIIIIVAFRSVLRCVVEIESFRAFQNAVTCIHGIANILHYFITLHLACMQMHAFRILPIQVSMQREHLLLNVNPAPSNIQHHNIYAHEISFT